MELKCGTAYSIEDLLLNGLFTDNGDGTYTALSTTNDDMMKRIAGYWGSRYTSTGAGTKTFTANAHGLKAWEDTTITLFKDSAGANVTIGWESKVIPAGETIWFGTLIKSIVVTVGGKCEYFLAESDL